MTVASETDGKEIHGQSSSFYVIAGTYERLLYGLTGELNAAAATSTEAETANLEPVFIYPAHINCIKSLAATPRFLATGSTDEQVKLYDLRARKEVGTLMHHSGTVTALAFFADTHLLTGAEDGTVAIVRTSDWEVLKKLRCNGGAAAEAERNGLEPATSAAAVTGMAVHPSGRVLLTVSRNGGLRCWDLTRGVCAFQLRLRIPAERVAWSPLGTHYALMTSNAVAVHVAASAAAGPSDASSSTVRGAVGKIELPRSRFNAMAFTELDLSGTTADAATISKVAEGVIVCGAEDRTVTVATIDGTILMKWASGHGARIKDVAALLVPITDDDCAKEDTKTTKSPSRIRTLITTCSSDGGIAVWDLAECYRVLVLERAETQAADTTTTTDAADVKPPRLAEFDAKCRLTCVAITLVDPKAQKMAEARAAAVAAAAQAAAYATDASDSEYEDSAAPSRHGPRVTVSYETHGSARTSQPTGSANKKTVPVSQSKEQKTNKLTGIKSRSTSKHAHAVQKKKKRVPGKA